MIRAHGADAEFPSNTDMRMFTAPVKAISHAGFQPRKAFLHWRGVPWTCAGRSTAWQRWGAYSSAEKQERTLRHPGRRPPAGNCRLRGHGCFPGRLCETAPMQYPRPGRTRRSSLGGAASRRRGGRRRYGRGRPGKRAPVPAHCRWEGRRLHGQGCGILCMGRPFSVRGQGVQQGQFIAGGWGDKAGRAVYPHFLHIDGAENSACQNEGERRPGCGARFQQDFADGAGRWRGERRAAV